MKITLTKITHESALKMFKFSTDKDSLSRRPTTKEETIVKFVIFVYNFFLTDDQKLKINTTKAFFVALSLAATMFTHAKIFTFLILLRRK